jgi:hypothetical protein
MVDSLRRSIEGLQPPTCPNCHLDMRWYRSIMVAPAPVTITHYFACPNCSRVAESQSILARDADPPTGKLSAPVSRAMCAA